MSPRVTVTQLTPKLLVLADGADTACPAEVDAALDITIGDRVDATLRTPNPPLIGAGTSVTLPTADITNTRQTRYGVDYSVNSHSNWAGFFDALLYGNRDFIVRYILTSTGGKPDMQAAELAAAQSAGVDVAFWYERVVGTQSALGGNAQGQIDGADAKVGLAALSIATDQPVYYSCDGVTNPSSTNKTLVKEYCEGIAAVSGLSVASIGIYASRAIIEYLQSLPTPVCTYYCQALWFHDGPVLPNVHMTQSTVPLYVAGVTCDRDVAYFEDFGQL